MRAIGIVLAGGNASRMKELTNKRAVAAMPIAGSYRAVDFALSSLANSRVQKVAVLTQYNSRSLNEHMSSSKWWDFGRKQGGLYVFTPTITADNSFWYRGTADSIYQNIDFLRNSHEPYVVITSGDIIYKLDFNKVLEEHIENKADITIVCKRLGKREDTSRYGIITTAEDGRITSFDEKPIGSEDEPLVSAGIYVIRRRQLIEMLERANEEERYDLVRDIIIRFKDVKKIYAFEHKEYWRNIASVNDYYDANMDFLNHDIRDYFFRQYPDVYSKVDDLPPAKYNAGAEVRNSLIASGTIVNGRIENSVIFKQVYIGNNCTIRNSIILNGVHIGDNTYIENCIVESKDTIKPGSNYTGQPGSPRIVLERSDRYGM
ncbi:MAG: glucose-1-phosphate adenylyltransferase subunit GlgD [Lachnospiraceae bacterium]|jgi:glucose-1-phosphate adenylyltransferase|nr:glucose-1-phosphate adenylyltransferase subunit GlgD [Lachnospiraceae bacterium]MBR4776676.1 glucose-1-phosphate adenylyltransferase subunit GlgD [Lachnospiraceae bacterium]MBR4816470.1 glucose-1-phosphate adenylyltransferase subunit GlgD [Lachnospiraceae bacterium]